MPWLLEQEPIERYDTSKGGGGGGRGGSQAKGKVGGGGGGEQGMVQVEMKASGLRSKQLDQKMQCKSRDKVEDWQTSIVQV